MSMQPHFHVEHCPWVLKAYKSVGFFFRAVIQLEIKWHYSHVFTLLFFLICHGGSKTVVVDYCCEYAFFLYTYISIQLEAIKKQLQCTTIVCFYIGRFLWVWPGRCKQQQAKVSHFIWRGFGDAGRIWHRLWPVGTREKNSQSWSVLPCVWWLFQTAFVYFLEYLCNHQFTSIQI